ncbi:MAG: hypothetical protein IT449_10300 [Phycisphaerales bacterium]|nr:hypothetical protein [Phycisphaerales bacterium]
MPPLRLNGSTVATLGDDILNMNHAGAGNCYARAWPHKPARRIQAGLWLAAVLFSGAACNRTDPLTISFDGDEITHLEVLAEGMTGPPYPRIGDPKEVERFTAIMRLPAGVADARVAADERGRPPMFWVRWASGRECRVRIGDDKKLRFWHLEIPLTDDDHQHLASLVHHAGDWPLAKP